MPTLDDLPTLAQATSPTGDDLFPIYDLTANGSSKVRKIALNQIIGLSATDATLFTTNTGANTIAVTTRLTLIISGTSSTTTVNIPAPSGALRVLNIMNGGSGNATLTSAAANIKTAAVTTAATTSVLAGVTPTRLLSDGSFWYRVE
jgi:hypothetical protein